MPICFFPFRPDRWLALSALMAGFLLIASQPLFAQSEAPDGLDASARERIRQFVQNRSGGEAPALKLAAGTEKRTLEQVGLSRSWLLHLPKNTKPEKPAPLIIALHGAATNGAITEGLTEFSPLSDQEGFLVVYPDADPKGGLGIWDFWTPQPAVETASPQTGRDDIGFIGAIIDTLVAEKLADPRRIYLTGLSNGSFMTNRLAIDFGDRIAAIAGVAGTAPKIGAEIAVPKRPMPVLYFHGTADRFVGIDGVDFLSKGNHSLGAEELVAWWAQKNGCSTPPEKVTLPDLDPADGCTVERTSWKAGEKGAPVIFYRIIGGGHTWPGGSQSQPEGLLGKVCRDIDASELMWQFFSKHSLSPPS